MLFGRTTICVIVCVWERRRKKSNIEFLCCIKSFVFAAILNYIVNIHKKYIVCRHSNDIMCAIGVWVLYREHTHAMPNVVNPHATHSFTYFTLIQTHAHQSSHFELLFFFLILHSISSFLSYAFLKTASICFALGRYECMYCGAVVKFQ